jgi:hypothetical protein
LGHETGYSGQDSLSLDFHNTTGGSGLRRRLRQSSVAQTPRFTEAVSCSRKSKENWAPNQHWKTEVISVNNSKQAPITLHRDVIKDVDNFVYLDITFSKNGGTDDNIECRINKGRFAFNTLRPI